MEKSTLIGVLLAFTTIPIGMVLKGASLSVLANPAAVMIIFAGTAACLFNAFATHRLKDFPKLLKLIFKGQQLISKVELIRFFKDLSQTARREGILALESKLGEINEPFLRNGLMMVIDGMDSELVRDVLYGDVQAMEERHRDGALIFTQAGTYAPTLGVLGAVVGLIGALGNLTDIDKLGHSIAAAFVATLFGIFSGYVIWHPFGNKLKQLSKEEVEIKMITMEGILSVQAGDSPMVLESKLRVFLTNMERKELEQLNEQEGGNGG